jgi:hypothetical protein
VAKRLCTVQQCPVYNDIGPYFAILANDTHAKVLSIYRGDDAARLLHKHGKHTQRELYTMFRDGKGNPANPPGYSTHELKSDGSAYKNIPRGKPLPWWCQGIDVNDADTTKMIAQAKRYGWILWRPYPTGNEYHHLNFKARPKPTRATLPRILRLRVTLPR